MPILRPSPLGTWVPRPSPSDVRALTHGRDDSCHPRKGAWRGVYADSGCRD